MNDDWRRDYVDGTVAKMRPGEYVRITADVFDRAFRDIGFPSIYRNPRESFLSKQVGSGYGYVTCERHESGEYYTIGVHDPGPNAKLVYVDPDRESWFIKQPDGTYEPRSKG